MSYISMIFLALILMLEVTAISANDVTVNTSSVTNRSPAPDGASVHIEALQSGTTLPSKFTIKFLLEGMSIAPAGSKIENTGHHHLLIDLSDLPDLNKPLPATDHVRHFGKGQTETNLTLEEGVHTLQLLFADYMHIPHDPPLVSERITITVTADP